MRLASREPRRDDSGMRRHALDPITLRDLTPEARKTERALRENETLENRPRNCPRFRNRRLQSKIKPP